VPAAAQQAAPSRHGPGTGARGDPRSGRGTSDPAAGRAPIPELLEARHSEGCSLLRLPFTPAIVAGANGASRSWRGRTGPRPAPLQHPGEGSRPQRSPGRGHTARPFAGLLQAPTGSLKPPEKHLPC